MSYKLAFAAVAGAAGLLSSSAIYAGNTWTGSTNQDWNTAGNWGGALPTAANITVNTATGNFPKITTTPSFSVVDIIVGVGVAGRLDQTAATLNTGNANWLVVGRSNGGNGTFNLADTAATGGTYTGFGLGSGSVNVGGTSTTIGRLTLGDGGSSVGTVNMNTSGTLKLEQDDIGLLMGGGGTSVGNFNFDAGTLQINSVSTGIGILVGTNGGDGNFRMSGGVANITGGLWVGDNNAGSQGTVTLSGGTLNFTGTNAIGSSGNGQVFIGRGLGQGTVTVSGATVTMTGATNIGFTNTATSGTSGVLTVSSGSYTNTSDMRVGSAQNSNTIIAAGSGTLNVSGGTVSVGGVLQLARGNDSGDLVNGTVNVSAGTLNVEGDFVNAYAGNGNSGSTNITGGTVNVGTTAERWFIVNQYDSAKGTVTINGGTVNLNTNTDFRFSGGNGVGASTATLSSGAITSYSGNQTGSATSGIVDLNFGGAAAANNTFNLNGGTLTISQIITTSNNGIATFNFNGGTLKASNTSANFLDLGGATQTAKVESGGAVVDSNTYNITFVQALVPGTTSGGGLTKSGDGTLTLAAANTYTGATNVNGGTLELTGTLTSNITANTGGVVAGSGTTTGSIALNGGAISASTSGAYLKALNFNVSAGGIFTLTGTPVVGNTYTLVDYGVGGAVTGSLPALSGTVRATLSDDVANHKVTALVQGVGTRTWNTNSGIWQASGSFTNFVEGDQKFFNGDTVIFPEPAANSTVTVVGGLSPASTTFNSSTYNYTLSGTGSVANGTLTKSGSSTLTINTNNSYTGATTINGGAVSVTSPTNLGALTNSLSIDNGTLITNNIGNWTNGARAITVGAGGATLIINSTGSFGTGQFYMNVTNTLLGSGSLTVQGNGTLNSTGAGNLRLDKANPFNGTITLQSGGSLEYGVVGAVNSATTVNLGNEGELIINSNNTPLAVNANGGTNSTIGFSNGTTGNLSGNLTLNANAVVALRDWYNPGFVRGGTISGAISGTGGLTVNSGTGNGGLLTLATANSYSGGTTLNASKVLASTSTSLGTGAVTVGGTNGQLQLASGVSVANNITINSGAGVGVQGVIYVPSGSATVGGDINVNAVATAGGHFAAASGTLTLTGAITSSVPLSTRLGTLVLTNTSSSYSQLQVHEGVARIGATNAIPTGASVALSVSNATGATLDLNGFDQTITGITKATAAGAFVSNGAASTLSTLTTTGTSTYDGVIQNGAGTVALNVISGALTLTGANTYTGNTTLSGGTLLVNGSTTSDTNVSGGTLGGTGAIGGSVTLSGGTLSPGASIQTLAVNSLSMDGSATLTTLTYEAAGTGAAGADLLVDSGSLSLTDVVFNATGLDLPTWSPGNKLTVISYNGSAITSGFAGMMDDWAYAFGSNWWLVNYNDTSAGSNFPSEATGANFVTLTAMVPEPTSTVASLMLGAGSLFSRRRRGRR